MNKIELRSDVTVELIQHMGSDSMIAAAARVSTKGELSKMPDENNAGLINFLMKNRHGTPFEHGAMTFFIQAPIFVFREFHRHRVGWSYNEESGRYRELKPVFYLPDDDRPLIQEGKPGHYTFVPGDARQHGAVVKMHMRSFELAYENYKALLLTGIAKEVARGCLPVAIFSSMYATCNPRSLMHFLSLRTKRQDSMFPSYPQREIEMVAEKMEELFELAFPRTYEAFCKNGRVAP